MKKICKTISILLVSLFVSGLLIIFLLPKPPLLDGIQFSRALYDENHQLLRLTLSQDEKFRVYVPLEKISKNLIEGTLLQEDHYFYSHPGVNPISLVKALWQTYAVQSRRIGASTITMQLARIRYGINSKQFSGKLWQMIRAIQLEMNYSKNEILEAYLNLAPYGGNIEGAGAASLVFFNRTANQLSLAQALTLSVIPQNPGKRTPENSQLKNIRDKLFVRWQERHPEDSIQKSMFRLPLVMGTTRTLPFKMPHLVNHILSDHSLKLSETVTTVDPRLQAILERITKSYLSRKRAYGVHNAAVMVVDTRDMSVKAMLGSADFFNHEIGGQINGTEIKRSPGSTLKPFIYGLAIDQGLIHPNTVLNDVPSSFKGYNPENFDYEFIGPVKAKDALVLSRNIPAIYLSNLLKKPSLYQLLEQAGISNLRSESYYGLSLSLGGGELSMRELIGLYAMLVNDGLWKPVRMYQDEPHVKGRRLLSTEASFLILDMLKATSVKGFGSNSNKEIPVALKTGTSSGYRDAWTLGTFGPYVMAVWVGNFNNQANPAFIGKDIAAPLFMELVDAIKHEKAPLPVMDKDPGHMNLKRIEICSVSGMLPTRFCPDTEYTWFIPGKSPIKTDTIYREVAINSTTGLRTCHINENTRFEVFEFWPSDVLSIF